MSVFRSPKVANLNQNPGTKGKPLIYGQTFPISYWKVGLQTKRLFSVDTLLPVYVESNAVQYYMELF